MKTDSVETKKLRASNRNLRKHLKDLVAVVTHHLAMLDKVMQRPATVERGQTIARLCNALEMTKDLAVRYGLDAGKESAG